MKIHIVVSVILVITLSGCSHPRKNEQKHQQQKQQLEDIEKQMTRGHSAEAEVDKKILEAVKQLAATLQATYKRRGRRKYKIGFLEVSDGYRMKVAMLHKYVTEKMVTFSFLQPAIVNNFNFGERFFLKEIEAKTARPCNYNHPGCNYPATNLLREQIRKCIEENNCHYPTIELELARRLGRLYRVDVIETGVITESPDFLDINLRLIETRNPRVIAVGTAKIEKTELVKKWLCEVGTICW
ncbi:MAG: hypothetical protein GY795_14880 [Desulfobacterales bacterium]|nr:hypothetical protein [Desulfobacterales bacterium]